MRSAVVGLLLWLTMVIPSWASPVTVPTSSYGPEKTAVMATVGGGEPVLTEVDTGSGVLVVEKSWAGPQVRMTTQNLTITYGSGRVPRSGTVGYAHMSLLAHGEPVLTTTVEVPVLVVADGVVSRGGANHAILGLRMSSSVSPRLFFPSPCDRMMIIDRPHATITFGSFTTAELGDFGLIRLAYGSAVDHNLHPTTPSLLHTWNDSAVKVRASVAGGPPGVRWNALFDSGALTNFHAAAFPPYFKVRNRILGNAVTVTVGTSRGRMTLPLTDKVFASKSTHGDMLNTGNALFNHYRVLFDQLHGTIGLAPLNARPQRAP